MNNYKKNAIDFLLFSYFSFSLDDLNNNFSDVMSMIIERAYRDATQQGAFNTFLTDDNKDAAGRAYQAGVELIKEKLCGSQPPQINDYNTWHADFCQSIVERYKSKQLEHFTYGNAQKWVNMTMKYIMILVDIIRAVDDTDVATEFMNKYGSLIDTYRTDLHVPVDSYIIKAVWEDEGIKLPLIEDKLLKDGSRGSYSSEKVVAWSKWENEQVYIGFSTIFAK